MTLLDLAYTPMRVSIEAMAFCVAGFCVLGVWAGLSHRHWFVRALIVAVAVTAMAPIRAYEPLLLFLIITPAIAMSMAVTRRLCRAGMLSTLDGGPDPLLRRRLALHVFCFTTAAFALLLSAVLLVVPISHGVPLTWFSGLSWYEQTAAGTLIVVLAVLTILEWMNPRTELPQGGSAAATPESVRYHFRVRDLLLMTVVLAVASAGVLTSVGKPIILSWLPLLATAVSLVLITVTAASVVLVRRLWFIPAIALLLAAAASIAVHTWLLPDAMGIKTIAWLDEWPVRFTAFFSAALGIAADVVAMTWLMLVSGALSRPRAHQQRTTAPAIAPRIGLTCVCLAIFAPLLVVYARMLDETPLPAQQLPATNAYPQIIAAVEKLHRLNPSESTISEIRRLGHDAKRVKEIAATYSQLIDALEQPAFVPWELEKNARAEYLEKQHETVYPLRVVARTLQSESQDATVKKDYGRAVDFGLATVQLGSKQQIGGDTLYSLVGIAIEGIGVFQLSQIRDDLSLAETLRSLNALQAVARDREPTEWTIQRTAYICDSHRSVLQCAADLSPLQRHICSLQCWSTRQGRRRPVRLVGKVQ